MPSLEQALELPFLIHVQEFIYGTVQDLAFVFATVAQSVLRLYVLLAEACGKEDLRHYICNCMLQIVLLVLLQRSKVEEFSCLR